MSNFGQPTQPQTLEAKNLDTASKAYIKAKKEKLEADMNKVNQQAQTGKIEANEEAGEECTCDRKCPIHGDSGHEEAGENYFMHRANKKPFPESTQITSFIKALSQKNYAVANKYLQGVVESKLKRSISKAYNK